ncbi:hypothetical protein [Phyllobacterium sp. YR531]|uniref:hypothetical protein n=1 Tax=Phyllobacterium sp. YR531 TaxID=1144343 RepID=UPI00026F75B0|nr:hypothetical protein [Phyllobacterium sp. YR531]EJN01653.1 hypothetical protein PMI41_03368 [Phyllobacterium sp. YR531]
MKTIFYGIALVSACLFVSGCETSDLSKTYTGSTTLVVPAKSGQKTPLSNMFTPNDDCSSGRPPSIKVVSGPAHGSVNIVRSTVSPTFEPGNALHKCNSRKLSAVSAVYVSAPGYVGKDSVRVSSQVAGNPTGYYDYYEFRIDVTK